MSSTIWRKFSLRTLLLFTTVLTVLIGWISVTGSQQRAARKELQDIGAVTWYDHQRGSAGTKSLYSRTCRMLTQYIDADLMFPVTEVVTRYEDPSIKLSDKYTASRVIGSVAKLRRLKRLRMSHCNIENGDVARLTHLTQLEQLDLQGTKLREGPIPGLDQLPLTALSLSRTRINDATLVTIGKMTKLEHLNLTRTKITDAGLEHLDSLPKLRRLFLNRSLVTRAGYEAFKQTHPHVDVSWEPLD